MFIILQNGLKIPRPALTHPRDAGRKTEGRTGTAMGTKPPSRPSHPKQRCFFLESSWTWGKSEGGRRFLGNEQASYRDCFPPRTNRSVPQSNPRAFILTLMGQDQGTGEVVANGAPIIWHPEGGEGELPASRFTVFLLAQSGHMGCCAEASFDCVAVRCPFQTGLHPQLHASCRDCSGCSSCSLLLWSLQLRCQGW